MPQGARADLLAKQTGERMLIDLIREYRIRRLFWKAVGTKDNNKKMDCFQKMNALIRQRSPHQVKRMERRMGLL